MTTARSQRRQVALGLALVLVAAPAAAAGHCAKAGGLPAGWGRDARAGMVRVPAGAVQLGTTQGYADERPAGPPIQLKAFWMDATEVTNAQFAAFVKATGYRTEAEREGGAAVFRVPEGGEITPNGWWRYLKGASWRQPEGPGSSVRGRENQPVVQVTRADAEAYARWLGRSLPSEAQWEYAAKAGRNDTGLDRAPRDAAGKPLANFWQGNFPTLNTREDGYLGRSPVGCFPANRFGLFDTVGNVWEWTRDAYTGPHQPHGNGDPYASVAERAKPLRRDASGVIKGGSFLCAANFCVRYRAAARHPQEINLPTSHVGFRTVRAD